MEILQARVMRGPNYWSDFRHKLIVLNIKLAPEDVLSAAQMDMLSNQFRSFRSGDGVNYEDTANLVAKLAIALQCMAGMDCAYTDVRATKDTNVFNVIFSYLTEAAGKNAGKIAVSIINSLTSNVEFPLSEEIEKLKQCHLEERLGPSTQAIIDEALQKNIPVNRLDKNSLMMLGQGANQHLIRSTVADTTNAIAVDSASNKELTKQILNKAYLPTPIGDVANDENKVKVIVKKIGFPIVIKPLNGNHGRGITTYINSLEDALQAFKLAQKISRHVIVERHTAGDDYRILVINYELVAVAKRTAAQVIGDGRSTIQMLIDQINQDPKRGDGHQTELTKIKIDAHTLALLHKKQLTLQSVLSKDQPLSLKETANISTGGTAEDVTDIIHPFNKALAERTARLLKLDICGIDIMANDISKPLKDGNGAILEVNAGPGLRMHHFPTLGKPRNAGKAIVEMLYPEGTTSRIPVVAITGTNGKTTTTRLIAHLARQAGRYPGYTTTDGIYLNNELITEGDCSGPESAAVIFRDPQVNFAVLECARGGILRSGLGFDHCDISIVTNVSGDHLGLQGIETIEQLADVKAVVPKSTSLEGYAILNADDDLVYKMRTKLSCNVALFSLNAKSERIAEHCANGNLACVAEDGYFIIYSGNERLKICSILDAPLTFKGTASSMIANILPAILSAYISNFSIADIQLGLQTFIPSPTNTPGRMNTFSFNHCELMVDYAHNEGGYLALKDYASHLSVSAKTGIVAAVGDRLEEDIKKIGKLAAEIFDIIIIRSDKNGRGRTGEQVTALIIEGIRDVNPDIPIQVIPDVKDAIVHALHHAKKGSWIFVNSDDVRGTIKFVEEQLTV